MSDILRSILPDEPRGDDPKLMFQNYCSLKESVLRFDLPSIFSCVMMNLGLIIGCNTVQIGFGKQ